MKVDKKVKAAIEERFRDTPHMGKSEVVALLKELADEPDIETLREQEYGRTATRIISSITDESKLRRVFTVKQQGIETEYVDADNSKDLTKIIAIEQTISRQYEGLNTTLQKIIRIKEVLIGQTELGQEDDDDAEDSGT